MECGLREFVIRIIQTKVRVGQLGSCKKKRKVNEKGVNF